MNILILLIDFQHVTIKRGDHVLVKESWKRNNFILEYRLKMYTLYECTEATIRGADECEATQTTQRCLGVM